MINNHFKPDEEVEKITWCKTASSLKKRWRKRKTQEEDGRNKSEWRE